MKSEIPKPANIHDKKAAANNPKRWLRVSGVGEIGRTGPFMKPRQTLYRVKRLYVGRLNSERELMNVAQVDCRREGRAYNPPRLNEEAR